MASQPRRKRGQQEQDTPYVKYLKYQNTGFKIGASDKTLVWVPTGKPDVAFTKAEVTNDDGKNFTYRTDDGETKTVPKTEKTYFGVNPPKFDGVEDMAELGYLSEAAVLYNLKRRYETDVFHTYSGLFLVVINPYKRLPIYTKEIINIYRGRPRDKVAPHIFAISDGAYRAMLQDRQDQSMLITGESGAGKTENTKKVIQYLAAIAGSATEQGSALEQQLLEFNPILEAFGNAKTTKNNNSSRFGKFIELQFNAGGQIAGANTFIYLLEKSRVVSPGSNERNFHVFYQMLSSGFPAELKQQLKLTRPQDFHFLRVSGCFDVVGTDDAKEYDHSCQALDIMKVTEIERVNLFRVLGAILHMGNLPFSESGREVAVLDDETALNTAAQLLDVPAAKLKSGILTPRIRAGNEWVTKSLNKVKSIASRDALCKALYGRLFLWVVRKINKVLSHPDKKTFFIGVLDISGFEIFVKNSFEQLCINFTNEKLQQFFNHHMFTLEQEEYEREKIDWSFVDFGMDSQDTIDLIEKKPMGILSILDEQSVFPDADDTSFTQKLHSMHESHRSFRKPRFVANTFTVIHYAGNVEYDTSEWLEKNRDPLEEDLRTCLSASGNSFVVDLFDESLQPSFKPLQPEADAKSGGSRRGSSGRGGPQRGGGAQFITVANQYKEQLTHLMTTLRKTNPHFIRCILPNQQQKIDYVHDQVVMDQLKCNGVLEGIRITRKGFPNRIKYPEFLKRYYLLKPNLQPRDNNPKQATQELVDFLADKFPDKVNRELLRYGLTKIFFRTGQLAVIEEMRERIISQMIISIQAASRAFLARRLYTKMREQTISAKILQRNIRAWLALREWPWWRLYVKARPLIKQRNFQKEIDELNHTIKKLTQELDQVNKEASKLAEERKFAEEEADKLEAEIKGLRGKLADVEGEKTFLEEDAELLKKKIANLESELDEETNINKELEAAKRKLEGERDALKGDLSEEGKNKSDLAEAKRKVESERDDWRKKHDETVASLDALKKKEEDLQKQLREKNDALSEEEQIAETLRTKLKNTERTVEELRNELSEEVKAKNDLEREKKKLQEALDESRTALEDERAARDSATSQGSRLQRELDDLRSDLDSAKSTNASLEKNLKATKTQLKDIEEELEDERTVRGNVERQKKALETKVGELEGRTEDLEKAKTDLTSQLKKANNENDDLHKRLDEAEANEARLKKEKKNLDDDIAELEDELEAERQNGASTKKKLNQRIQELQQMLEESPKGKVSDEEVKKYEDEIEALRAELKAANDKITDLEKKLRDKTLELDDVKQDLEDAQRNNEKLTKDNRKLKGDLDEAKDQLDAEEEQRATLDATVRRQNNEIEDLKSQLSKAGDSKARFEDIRASLEREVQNLKAEIDLLNRKNAMMERENRDLKAKQEDLQYQVNQEKRTKDKGKQVHKELKKLLVEREAQNMDLISKFELQNESDKRVLEGEITELKEKNKRLTEKVKQLTDDFEALFKKLENRPSAAPAAGAKYSDEED